VVFLFKVVFVGFFRTRPFHLGKKDLSTNKT